MKVGEITEGGVTSTLPHDIRRKVGLPELRSTPTVPRNNILSEKHFQKLILTILTSVEIAHNGSKGLSE